MTAHSIAAALGWTFRHPGMQTAIRTLAAHFLLAFGATPHLRPKTHQDNTFHSKRNLWKH